MTSHGSNFEKSGRRGKPVVAFRSQNAARANIETKLWALVEFLSESERGAGQSASRSPDGGPLLDHCPGSVRQFNSWTSVSLPPLLETKTRSFFPNANDTLRLHRELHESVNQAIARVRALRALAVKKKGPLETVAELHRRVAEARLIADISKRAAKTALEKLGAALTELAGLRRAHEALEREVTESLLSAEAQLAALRKRNAELTKSFTKLVKLRAT